MRCSRSLPARRSVVALILGALAFLPGVAMAATGVERLNLTETGAGYFALVVFALAYLLVVLEENLDLRKSKPVLVAAGIIWVTIGAVYAEHGMSSLAETAFRETLEEYGELLLFLLVAMTYINALEERGVFDALRVWMVRKGFGPLSLFWITGLLSFFISPVADNLTTALLLGAVVVKVANDDIRFISIACTNVVVAANAGGAFSPFGDITTLMVWQSGQVPFADFFLLLMPSLVAFLVPALLMSMAVVGRRTAMAKAAAEVLEENGDEEIYMRRGARRILALFLFTIASAVICHSVLDLPPVLGMMTGLGYLQFFSYYLQRTAEAAPQPTHEASFDIFHRIARAEWDTLLFFYGVVMCVGGLGFLGYLALASHTLYGNWDPTIANVAIGVLSAVVDNIPIMYAVLTMEPAMSHGQWLLVTLTAGIGGSLLSIGSAAGVGLMGQARGSYTFFSHLRWTPAIALGFGLAVLVHLWMNTSLF